ncbi:hypothetical protein DRN41_07650 [Thermococci archaeon]|nr:MAG: hypothetical protein DRN41_07650 [Thermococci archaeon]
MEKLKSLISLILVLLFVPLIYLVTSDGEPQPPSENLPQWQIRGTLIGAWEDYAVIKNESTVLILDISTGKVLKKIEGVRNAFLSNSLFVITHQNSSATNIDLNVNRIFHFPIPFNASYGIKFENFTIYAFQKEESPPKVEIIYRICTKHCETYNLVAYDAVPAIYAFDRVLVLTFRTLDPMYPGNLIIVNTRGVFNVTIKHSIRDATLSSENIIISSGTGSEGYLYAFSLDGKLLWERNAPSEKCIQAYDGKIYGVSEKSIDVFSTDGYCAGSRVFFNGSIAGGNFQCAKSSDGFAVYYSYVDMRTYNTITRLCHYNFRNDKLMCIPVNEIEKIAYEKYVLIQQRGIVKLMEADDGAGMP